MSLELLNQKEYKVAIMLSNKKLFFLVLGKLILSKSGGIFMKEKSKIIDTVREEKTEILKKRLKEQIDKIGYTQEKVAQKVGISPSSISKYLNGNGFPDEITLEALANLFGVEPVRFDINTVIEYKTDVFVKVIVLAILCSCVCVLFAVTLNFMKSFAKQHIKNSCVRAFAGGILVVLLTVVLGTTDYNGAGMDIINCAMAGEVYGLAFLLKIVFTAITMSCGFKGGEIVPTFFIGSAFGCFAGIVFGVDPGICASLGLVALFSGMTKCPIAAFLLAIEVFSGEYMLLFLITAIIACKFSGKYGLYDNSINKFYKKERKE